MTMQKDPELGRRVYEHLESIGLGVNYVPSGKSAEERIDIIEQHLTQALSNLDMDLNDPDFFGTPRRIAKMWVNEYTANLSPDNFPKMTTVPNDRADFDADTFVAVKGIDFVSVCNHHLLPFSPSLGGPNVKGATIAYIPKGEVLGISKMSRLLDHFSTLQTQERQGSQVAEALKFILDTEDVAVYIDSVHSCMSTRGAKNKASTVTLHLSGRFKDDPEIRKEFLAIAKEG